MTKDEKLLKKMQEDPGPTVVMGVSVPEAVFQWFMGPELSPAKSKGHRLRKLIEHWIATRKK